MTSVSNSQSLNLSSNFEY